MATIAAYFNANFGKEVSPLPKVIKTTDDKTLNAQENIIARKNCFQ